MPAYPRREIVTHDEVGVYHCIARCVRRAFLCGVDPVSGVDHEHRKGWIRDQLRAARLDIRDRYSRSIFAAMP